MQNYLSQAKELIANRKRSIMIGLIAILGGYVLYECYSLLQVFEQNTTNNNTPVARSIKLLQSDTDARRSWTIFADRSEGSPDLKQVQAQNVEIKTYDAAGKQTLDVKGKVMDYTQNTSTAKLSQGVTVDILGAQITMTTNNLQMTRDKPTQMQGRVRFSPMSGAGKYILANSAKLSRDHRYLTLYDIQRSPIGNQTYISGGHSIIDVKRKNPPRLVLDRGARVDTPDITCTSQNLTVYMSGGKPQRALFRGAPVAHQNGKTIKADIIKYDFNTKQIKASGHIRSD